MSGREAVGGQQGERDRNSRYRAAPARRIMAVTRRRAGEITVLTHAAQTITAAVTRLLPMHWPPHLGR
ncbi:hypothetical protein Strvi_6253 [Streptomyces violaceusniger Tu 4113]|uniref:Uncharacterized protein n=1 Tax=Streptomyces violaceusniger (strain Tu 4113) TaxID=653045 RepID=G2NVH6_STRV4|nr:hypothetical protein Strvi_6253 [Streptomyces violaceusniger Tu 4113]